MQLVPNSWGSLQEFNPCHNGEGPGGGRFCPTGGPAGTAGPALNYTRPPVTKVKTVAEAITLIGQGKVVELESVQQVHTLIKELAQVALDMAARGEQAPNFDLCNVTVANTNIFCGSSLRSKEFPNGVPRMLMPQFRTAPEPGSPADKLPRVDKWQNVDATDLFIEHLKALGIPTDTTGKAAASTLMASQTELVGANVARMMASNTLEQLTSDPIIVTRDNYVLDGHHRWAAAIGLDAADGRLGDVRMRVIRMDAPMSELLLVSRIWTKQFGLLPQAAKAKA